MKLRSIFLLLPLFFSFTQASGNDRFLQEIATVFTPDEGLPDTAFSDIRLDESGNILAVSAGGEFVYEDESWKISSKPSSDPAKGQKDSNDKALSTAEYRQKEFVGKKDGLFVQGKKKNEWIEVFPSDGNYSWKLTNVTVLLADSRDRLWFGSNEGAGYLQNGVWHLFTGKEGLPYKYFTCIAEGADGEIWYGTRKGAIRT
ncbi:MAG: hypothetical protein KAT15_09025, partial [Bacteroidales bacterium]|nr:hypothetical protein [Bacteroidales bacterium]